MNKLDILRAALETRNSEILNYQINIDNFERAIKKINLHYIDKSGMNEFKDNLLKLLESNKTEQLKAIIIRDVITEQISELENK